jgi:outer membrane murein-binding lipoprotein Lpp
MKRILIVLALAAAGCASSAKIERGAQAHLNEAERLDKLGDHEGAASERYAAEKQFEKARVRADQEAHRGSWTY